MANPRRGDVWLVDLDPVRGHEPGGTRPVLVVSNDRFNSGPADLLIVVPVTSKSKAVPSVVRMTPPDGGIRQVSFAKPEDIRSISKRRLIKRWGSVSVATMRAVEDWLRIFMEL